MVVGVGVELVEKNGVDVDVAVEEEAEEEEVGGAREGGREEVCLARGEVRMAAAAASLGQAA